MATFFERKAFSFNERLLAYYDHWPDHGNGLRSLLLYAGRTRTGERHGQRGGGRYAGVGAEPTWAGSEVLRSSARCRAAHTRRHFHSEAEACLSLRGFEHAHGEVTPGVQHR